MPDPAAIWEYLRPTLSVLPGFRLVQHRPGARLHIYDCSLSIATSSIVLILNIHADGRIDVVLTTSGKVTTDTFHPDNPTNIRGTATNIYDGVAEFVRRELNKMQFGTCQRD